MVFQPDTEASLIAATGGRIKNENDIAEVADQARAAAAARAWHRAADLWKRVVDFDPDCKDALLGQSAALRESSRMVEAEQVLAIARERFPDDYDVAVASARNVTWMREWPLAIARWQTAQKIRPTDMAAVYGEAEARSNSGDRAGAERLYLKLFEHDSGAFWTHWGYARTAVVALDWEAAIERWRVVQKLFPASSAGFVGEAEAMAAAGNILEADRLLAGVIEQFPGDHAAAREYARISLQRYDRKDALTRVAALRALPGFSDAKIGPPIVGTILSRDPLIVHAASYSIDAVVRPMMQLYGDVRSPVYFFFNSNMSLLFHHELRQKIPTEIRQLNVDFPAARITFLANDVHELIVAREECGLKAELINNNAFVDENIYVIRRGCAKQFDAIYNARFKPYKRFELAAKVKNLCVTSALISPSQRAEMMKMIPGVSVNERHLSGQEIVDLVNASKCSLCLSRAEGAMYASIESLLCGVPIVTTRSVGGRDWFFMDDYVIYVEESPEAVVDGVNRMGLRAPPPDFIRQTTIERLERERRMFFALVDRAFAESGQENRRFEPEFRSLFHDKMNYQNRTLSEFLFDT